ncbi:MAG: hypothetical protein V4662_01455 [Verrucomicrobiota bacterium]
MSLTCAAALRAQDSLLPLPVAGPDLPVMEESVDTGSRFLKPTKSIKPPVTAVSPSMASALQPHVNVPTAARLRRLILMPGGLPPEAMREQIAAIGQSRQPVTAVGMTAPAHVLAKLADLFGSNVNDDTQKKVVDAVRQGMSTDATAKAAPRRVEVVGWAPAEGVMTVVVYPES